MRLIFHFNKSRSLVASRESDLRDAILDSIGPHREATRQKSLFVVEAPTKGGRTVPRVRCTYARRRIDGRTQESLRKANQPRSLNRRPLVSFSFSLGLPLAARHGAALRRASSAGEKNRRAEPTIASPKRTQRYRQRVLCGPGRLLVAATSFRGDAGR